MAETLKSLAQSAPVAATPTDLYVVPAATAATVSSVFVCNRAGATTFRLWVAVAGAVTANQQYLYFDTAVPANDTLRLPGGITLAATDVIRCQDASGSVSFNVFGAEIT